MTWPQLRVCASVLLTTFIIWSTAAAPVGAQPLNPGRIVGGQEAADGAWRWQVVLFRPAPSGEPRAYCGGSLIAPDWVLTAAHCVAGVESGMVQVGFGSNRISTMRRVGVTAVYPHTGWNRFSNTDDIALLHLSARVTGPGTGFVALPFGQIGRSALSPQSVIVTGFGSVTGCQPGQNEAACEMQDSLRQVQLPVVESVACRSIYSERADVGPNQVCAGRSEGGTDSCQGDSGGPMVEQTPASVWVQIGIVSWGDGCARPGTPGVYTRVAAYEEWILRRTGPIAGVNPLSAISGTSNALDAIATNLITVRIAGDLHVGSSARFEVASRVSGYLLIFDVNPSGRLTQLLPNQFSGRGAPTRIDAGQTITFPSPSDPFDIRAPGPPGQGLVVAVVTRDPTGLAALIQTQGRLSEIEDMTAFYRRLDTVLRGRPVINPASGVGDWAMAEFRYTVAP